MPPRRGLEIFVRWVSTKIPLLTELRKGAQVSDQRRPGWFRRVWIFRARKVERCGLRQGAACQTERAVLRNPCWRPSSPVP